jgi:hypothetical protein
MIIIITLCGYAQWELFIQKGDKTRISQNVGQNSHYNAYSGGQRNKNDPNISYNFIEFSPNGILFAWN